MVRILDGTHPDGWEMPKAEIKNVDLKPLTVRQMTDEERNKYGDPVPRTSKARFKTIHDMETYCEAVPEIDPVMERQKAIYNAYRDLREKHEFTNADAAAVMGVKAHFFSSINNRLYKRRQEIVETVWRFVSDEDKISAADRRHAERLKGFKFGRKRKNG